MISTSGVLLRAAACAERSKDYKHLSYSLRQLYEHLAAVKEAHDKGESKDILDKLFSVWVDLDRDPWEKRK